MDNLRHTFEVSEITEKLVRDYGVKPSKVMDVYGMITNCDSHYQLREHLGLTGDANKVT